MGIAHDSGLKSARSPKAFPSLLTAFKQSLKLQTVRAFIAASLLLCASSTLFAAPNATVDPEQKQALSQPSRQIARAQLVPERSHSNFDNFPTAWWNWIFVSLFAFFGCGQLVLLLYQSNVIGKTLDATKRAVDTAERTAADFETPFLFPVLVSSSVAEDLRTLAEQESADLTVSPRVVFTMKNFGRTPALLQRASAVFFVGELEEAHNDPVSGRLPELMLEPLGSLTTPLEREIDQPIGRAALESMKNQTARLYLRGRITFLDVSGNRYEQIFCFAWDLETGGFIPWGPHRNRRKRLSSRRRRLS